MRCFSSTHDAGSSSSPYNAAAAARTLKLLERRKVTTLDIGILKRKKKPITMVTAYDYPSAVQVDLAGFDILLVGDSLGMVELVSRCLLLSCVWLSAAERAEDRMLTAFMWWCCREWIRRSQ